MEEKAFTYHINIMYTWHTHTHTHTHNYIAYVHMYVLPVHMYSKNAKRCDNEKYLVFYYKYQRLRPAPKSNNNSNTFVLPVLPYPPRPPAQLLRRFKIACAAISETCTQVWARQLMDVRVAELLRIQAQKIARNINTIRRQRQRRRRQRQRERRRRRNGKSETNGKRKRQNGWQTHKQHKKKEEALANCCGAVEMR